MAAIKYIARLNGKIVGTRKSVAMRTYTHAVVVNGHSHTDHVVCWNGRIDLARKEAAHYRGLGYRADVVEAEIVPNRVVAKNGPSSPPMDELQASNTEDMAGYDSVNR